MDKYCLPNGPATLQPTFGQSLLVLDLLENDIGDDGVLVLPFFTALRHLKLGGNRISAAGARLLALATNLELLDVSGNSLGDEGVIALTTLPHLTDLDVCRQDPAVTAVGASALAQMTGLQKLYICADDIGDEAAASLAAMPQLRALGLGTDGPTSAGVRHLTQLASTLEELMIWSEGRTVQQVNMVFSALAQLTGLTSLLWSPDGVWHPGGSTTWLTGLTRLQQLRLPGLELTDGATGLAALTNLTHLTLQDCSGHILVRLQGMSLLQDLDLMAFFWSRNWEAQALGNPAKLLKTTLSKLSKSLKKSWNGSRNASVNRLSKRCQFRAPANVTQVMIAVTHSKRACTRRVRMQSTQLGPQSCLVFGLMCSSTFCELLPTFIVEFCQQNPFQPNICKQHALERQRCELSKRTFRTQKVLPVGLLR